MQAILFDVDGSVGWFIGFSFDLFSAVCAWVPLWRFTSYTFEEFESSLYDRMLTSSACGSEKIILQFSLVR